MEYSINVDDVSKGEREQGTANERETESTDGAAEEERCRTSGQAVDTQGLLVWILLAIFS